jgi:type IV pilus assembly protein PilE
MPISHNHPFSALASGRGMQLRGWTLAELMIALALMSVLATLAMPSYLQQQRTARRSDGQAALVQVQVDQARWRSSHDQHADTLLALGWPSDRSGQGHYQITLVEVDGAGYTALATATGGQAQDHNCTPLRLTWSGSANVVLSAGDHLDSDPHRCWRR